MKRWTLARGTDDGGFYAVMTVLSDSGPLEMHRPRDMNVGDGFVSVSCPTGQPKLLEVAEGGRFYACPDSAVPTGRLDLTAALAAGDERAAGVCRSRLYLFEHMDAAGREAFRPAFDACAQAGSQMPEAARRAGTE